MKKALLIIDMQNDFISGSLGTEEARQIVPHVVRKMEAAKAAGDLLLLTQDTHDETYLETQEGRMLPVKHCIKGTEGWKLCGAVEQARGGAQVFEKETFGSTDMAQFLRDFGAEEIELVGLCTDICVISNALLIKAFLPEAAVIVDPSCCAGVTPESHRTALEAMKPCQILLRD